MLPCHFHAATLCLLLIFFRFFVDTPPFFDISHQTYNIYAIAAVTALLIFMPLRAIFAYATINSYDTRRYFSLFATHTPWL